jgi:hypothetical protein
VQEAHKAVATARNQENAYLEQHPGSTQGGDPNLAALASAVAAANSELAQANATLTADKGASNAIGSAQIIDAPSLPGGPTSGKKKELEGILGGLIAGMMISLLGTIALTRGKSDRWEDELAEGLVPASEGLALVGTRGPSATAAAPVTSVVPAGNDDPGDLLKAVGSHGRSHRRLVWRSGPSGPPTQ